MVGAMTTVTGSTTTILRATSPVRVTGDARARCALRVRVLAVAALGALLLAGCSAARDAGGADEAVAPGAVVGGDAGGEAGGGGAASDGGDGTTTSSDDTRLVVQTGSVAVTADDPLAAATRVTAYVEGIGGRVDSRSEQAATEGGTAYSLLTVRVPATRVTATVDHLRTLGDVTGVDLHAQDVTDAAQDLDARIHALEVSVQRMETLMQSATTTADLLDAESALSSRQADLEARRAERARLQDQVSLSTIEISIAGPGTLPAQTRGEDRTFLSGLADGWDALVTTFGVVVVLVGVLLPWLALAGVVLLVVVAVRRRRRPAATTPQPREPVTVGAEAGSAGGSSGEASPSAPPGADGR